MRSGRAWEKGRRDTRAEERQAGLRAHQSMMGMGAGEWAREWTPASVYVLNLRINDMTILYIEDIRRLRGGMTQEGNIANAGERDCGREAGRASSGNCGRK